MNTRNDKPESESPVSEEERQLWKRKFERLMKSVERTQQLIEQHKRRMQSTKSRRR